jgi:hypothetical protein
MLSSRGKAISGQEITVNAVAARNLTASFEMRSVCSSTYLQYGIGWGCLESHLVTMEIQLSGGAGC